MSELCELQGRLESAMEAQGIWPADSPWVRRAAQDAPRHAFAPNRV
ncbi:hypothetical protein BX261_7199 [Streptomyces sp. 2321.6]|nr:hypothetical protein BX261_7199 [Streptomyces sp. 2321.6]